MKHKKSIFRRHGTSIAERPDKINNREEMGDWEIIDQRSPGTEVRLTLTERVRRHEMIIKIPSKTRPYVVATLDQLKNE